MINPVYTKELGELHPTLADWPQLAELAQRGDREAARLMTERLMAFTAQTILEDEIRAKYWGMQQ